MLKVNSAVFTGNISNLINKEEDMEEHDEIAMVFGEFSAGVDMAELDEGQMVLDGYSVQEIKPETNPPKDWTKEGFTQEESDLLNLEVTDEIEDLIYDLAKEKGLVAQPLVEEVIFEDTPVDHSGIDYERAMVEAIPLFDQYFEASKKLDKAVDVSGWNTLRARRQLWWSHFAEEMDTNWLKLSAFESKADHRLLMLEKVGKEPSDEQWAKFMDSRKRIMRDCMDMQNKRYELTSGIYRKALAVTNEAKAFWKTPAGEAINTLRNIRSELYKELTTPRILADGSIIQFWDMRVSYFQLMEEELSPYFTVGDTSSVDDPETVAEVKETVEGLMDAHLLEESQIEAGDIRWMNWYDTWLTKRIDQKAEDSADYLAYVDSIVLAEEQLFA